MSKLKDLVRKLIIEGYNTDPTVGYVVVVYDPKTHLASTGSSIPDAEATATLLRYEAEHFARAAVFDSAVPLPPPTDKSSN